VKGHINDDALVTLVAPAVQQCVFDQPGAVVVEQIMPPFGGHQLGQQNGCQLPIIVFLILFIQKINQGADERPVRRRNDYQRDIRKMMRPLFLQIGCPFRIDFNINCFAVAADGARHRTASATLRWMPETGITRRMGADGRGCTACAVEERVILS